MLPIDTEFDVTFANEIARLETFNKHHYRPNSYLHKWWARRCGSTFRLILKQLVTEEAARDYYAPGGLAGKIILDPMMGGGTTLHEAIRLGANVIGADLDPIPMLQVRASLEEEVPLTELEQVYRRFYKQLRVALDPFFETNCPVCQAPTQLQYVLYGWRKHCACGPALFVDSLTLRQEADGTTLCLHPQTHAVYHVDEDGRGEETAVSAATSPLPPIYEKTVTHCPHCAGEFTPEYDLPHYARYEPLVVVGYCTQHRLFFKGVDEADRAALRRADACRETLPFVREEFAIEPGRKSHQLVLKGIENYLDLFSSRQLLYLARAIDLLQPLPTLLKLNLGLLVSTSLEFNSMLCSYKGAAKRRSGAIRHTFAHHAYAFPSMALENNPLFRRHTSGTLNKLFQARIMNGRIWAQQPRERKLSEDTAEFVPIAGEVDAGREVTAYADLHTGQRRFLLMQGSSTTLALPDDSVSFIVTDPPYFDSVQYSDLATFFRVWLRHLLPDAADWTYDITDSAVDPHKNDRASRYTELLTEIFQEGHRVLCKENGRLIFTFHHWNPKGWAALTLALRAAGFRLVSRYVVHAENPVSVHINKMKSLLHDAVLVLVPAEAAVRGAWQRPLTIAQESEAFTRDCATLLGWLLESEESAAAIQQIWREALT
ncbi:MAG: hypothetical protein R3E31_24735 [Chloroflexota bacterium]